jgi:shikimate dehydrogenase
MPDQWPNVPGDTGLRLFGLIGYPLTHSFSKKYFDQKFAANEFTDCRFENFPIESILEFPRIIDTYKNLRGLSVTIPHKRTVIPFLDDVRHIPSELNACNCVRIDKGYLTGYNTDHIGFQKSLLPLIKPWHKKALILGTGGAAAAVSFVLHKMDIPFLSVSRNKTGESILTYGEIDQNIMEEHQLVINTTPVGMYPEDDRSPGIPYGFFTQKHLAYDLIYNPGKTLFLEQAEKNGATIKNGEEMLEIQAEENWRIWGG